VEHFYLKAPVNNSVLQSMRTPQKKHSGRYFWAWLSAAILLGAWLRLDQFLDQTLIDDEWHAVHQLMFSSPSRFVLSFGHADYSIPLTLFYWLQAQWFGLSELGMRLPMMISGLLTVALFPLALRKEMGDRTVIAFAFLLACSPMLIAFSRMARPYALTLLLSFCAYACLSRAARTGLLRWNFAVGYIALATLSLWLHPIVGPFLVAPLFALWWNRLRLQGGSLSFRALLMLSTVTAIMMAMAILPPLLSDPGALSGKSGIDSIQAQTLVGVWYSWLGTGSTAVVLIALFLAAFGIAPAWRASQCVRWALLGLALTTIVILITRPAWIFHSLTLARYLLPALPILLLLVAAGFFRLLDDRLPQSIIVTIGVVGLVGFAFTSPLPSQWRHPNSNTLHLATQMDYRQSENSFILFLQKFPLSPFWKSLSSAPAGSITVAVAPFRFESFDWPAPIWESVSKQRVIPAYLSGSCEPQLYGNTLNDARFRFRNATHVGDSDSLERASVSYLAFFKAVRSSLESADKPYLPQCETWMRNHYGTPYFDDASLIVWKVDVK
jgi:Dolichyl-phosphate-mannose-protein mannosyltransferase